MYLRLAFAVAAHLEPEILLVDEVLAVGDAEFQKKCLTKMEQVGDEGRTVIFVSHNMPAITRLSQRVILLDDGGLRDDGPPHRVVGTYLRGGLGTMAERRWPDLASAPGNDIVRLTAATVRTEDGAIRDAVDIRKPVGIELEYVVLQEGHQLWPCFNLLNDEGTTVFAAIDHDPVWRRRERPIGRYRSTARIPGNLLAEGTMMVWPVIQTMHPRVIYVSVRDAVAFQVLDSTDGDSARGDWAGHLPGVIRPLLEWTTQTIAS
jgi:lipopolysaccharide transport system ATP-binding protein